MNDNHNNPLSWHVKGITPKEPGRYKEGFHVWSGPDFCSVAILGHAHGAGRIDICICDNVDTAVTLAVILNDLYWS